MVWDMSLILFDCFARNGACGIMQWMGPCDEFGLDGWDRADFHGGILLMVMVVNLCEDQCGDADRCQERLCSFD